MIPFRKAVLAVQLLVNKELVIWRKRCQFRASVLKTMVLGYLWHVAILLLQGWASGAHAHRPEAAEPAEDPEGADRQGAVAIQ